MEELNISSVEFSKWDRFFNVKIPHYLTTDLAYETGLHIGDGHLSICKRPDNSNQYYIVFSGDWKEERGFHYKTIAPLIHRLYHKKCQVSECVKNTVRTSFKSQAVATFKNRVLGLPSGKKSGKVRIPTVIMNSSSSLKAACLSGIVDTDFSVTFRRGGTYPRLSGVFPIKSKGLVNDVRVVFEELGMSPSVCIANRVEKRNDPPTVYKEYVMDINGERNLNTWARLVGFKSPKHYTKFLVWQRFGKCPSHTTLQQRKKLIAPVAQW